jgi:feruloyl-CoA synthase
MSPPRRVPALAEPRVVREDEPGGGFTLRSPVPLGPCAPSLGHWVARWAAARPDAVAFAERSGEGWRTLTWSELWGRARSIGQALVERGLSLERPVAILSGNGLEHALVAIGATLAGVPYVPVSVAYSTVSQDHAQLRHIIEAVTPGLIFVAQGGPFARALDALDLAGVEVVVGADPPAGRSTTPLSSLEAASPGPALAAAEAAVGPTTVAKIMMTSGSTDRPKGVLTTHGMLTANQQALAQAWPFVEATPPVLVDWLPWSHTFGGSHNFNLVLRNGGTLYIDAGRPAPGLFRDTQDNLRKVAPTIHFNVPAGYQVMVQALEADDALARTFFSRVDAVFYAAAALPQDVWDRLDRVASRAIGQRVWLTTAWGSTETSPLVTSAHFPLERAGNIGVPVPGCSLRFVPSGEKLELRVKGPNVTPGYHRDPARTAAAFDPEGFYRIGDAGRLHDPARPAAGVVFDGRAAEDFKLLTGTWVNVAEVRTHALSAAGGLLSNAVVTGHDRAAVGLLAWLEPAAARALVQEDLPQDDLRDHPLIRARLTERLAAMNKEVRGLSRQVHRLLLLGAPPSLDAGELTDKGYVNARAVLAHRGEEVAALYAEPPPARVIVVR